MAIFGKSYDYYLGYALSGGGAKGFAHLGALKVLERYGLKPDTIAGTSAGALAGVFYADGFHPDEIEELFRKKELREFVQFALPTSGFLKNAGLHSFLKKNLRATTFEELKMPFYAVTTDWNNARTVVFSRGEHLVDAVVASCSIPVIFYPQYIDDVPYVDGGLLKNFPVSVIREKCKFVIGVNVSLMVPPAEKNNIRRMAERTFNLMSNSNTLFDRADCDILIETKGLEKYAMFNLTNIDTISNLGFESALATMREEHSWRIIRRCHRHQELNKKIVGHLQRIKK